MARHHRRTRQRPLGPARLRGVGHPPPCARSPVDDVLDTLGDLEIDRCHLLGASFDAGVAVEVALARPSLVGSLLVSAPGGALISDHTADLRSFLRAEEAALARADLDGAIEANLAWWVDGPHRGPADVMGCG